MSNRAASVGGTLAGGIQDIAALLPLIGTEQCEKHAGSALTGGYLYAAATPGSIFGSLGIVKGGITILISSISIPLLRISISFSNYRPSITFSSGRKWLGGKVLKDAGFELVGSVAPLIGMEGGRFRAETRVVEMLEEKHIDDAEKAYVQWKSQKWNIMLVLSTILCAFLSVTPYIALLLGPASWKPTSVHLPWLFPALRIVGSCTAVVACQFITQCRVISLMKNRLLFMTIHQKLTEMHKDRLNAWLKDSNIKWDAALPAEQCLWSLKQYLSSVSASHTTTPATPVKDCKSSEQSSDHSPPGTPKEQDHMDHIAIGMNEPTASLATPSPQIPTFNFEDLRTVQRRHFPSPFRDTVFISLSWIFLLLSLPATVAGYIGCFTLVSATPASGNGPLIWVGLEAALSILRVLVWASNPAFDEETEVRVEIKLSKHQPMVTTYDYNPSIIQSDPTAINPFALIPEREFLEYVTPYTGPLDQLQKPDNIALYFTLTAEYECPETDPIQTQIMCVMTIFDSNMQIGVSLMRYNKSFRYLDVVVKYDTLTRQLEANPNPQTAMRGTRPWRVEDDRLFDSLETSYNYIIDTLNIEALNRQTTETRSATLFQKWDLSGKSMPDIEAHNIQSQMSTSRILTFTAEDVLYLDRGYEHQLKSELINMWGGWISMDMAGLQEQGSLECWEALRNATSENGKWELTELDCQLVWGRTRRELALIKLSVDLEGSLQKRMNECVSQVVDARKDERLRPRMSSEYGRVRRKRMEQERGAARKRMEAAMKVASEQAEKEGQPWQGDTDFLPQWTDAIKFIDERWSLAISNSEDGLKGAVDKLQEMRENLESWQEIQDNDRNIILQQLRARVSHELWHDQGQFERQMVEATVEAIRKLPSNSTREQLVEAYKFPEPDGYATAKFAYLTTSSSQGKACSAMVYDAERCAKEIVCAVVAKSTTRTVINVDPDIVASIPPNDHLLFLSCEDGEGEEPAFVRQNRDRWPGQQTQNSSMFYFTPYRVDGLSCWVLPGSTLAHILVFLTSSCDLRVSLIHRASSDKAIAVVSLQQNDTELTKLSDISNKFQLQDFPPFVLPEGRHELELVPEFLFDSGPSYPQYFLRDIIITLSPIITLESNPIEAPGPGIPIPLTSTASNNDAPQSTQEVFVSVASENTSEDN